MQIGMAMRKPGGLTLPQRIRQLFAAGEQGVWYDPSDLSTLFQDSAGTVPVTAVEQPVGLMLDKSKGLVLGPELVTNGGFDSVADWTLASYAAISGGLLNVGTSGAGVFASQPASVVAGKTYIVTFTLTVLSGSNNVSPAVGGTLSSIIRNATGTYTECIVAGGTGTVHMQGRNSGVTNCTIDNISVKELPGNHATQATSTKRPVLSAKVNLLTGSAALATQSVATAAIPYTLKQTGTGTITLSGTSTAGPLVGPGTLTFTPTAGTLTLTVSGSVTEAQLETGSVATRYQWVNTVADYDTVGFPKYLKFDGVDDSMSTASINFTATDKMTVVAGLRKLSDAAEGLVFETSADAGANAGAIYFKTPHLTTATLRFLSGGTAFTTVIAVGLTAPVSCVASAKMNISAALLNVRVNGVQSATSAATQGTGNYGNYPLFIGSRNNSIYFFNGNIYSLIIRGALSTDAQIINAETYVNSKTGAY